MKIAIVGGKGTLGGHVTAELTRRGHEVRVLSRSGEYQVDLTTGDGLADALRDCDAVVDASNASSAKRARQVLVEGSRRLLAAEAAAGVAHHVCISIVGCDQVPMGYYKVKTDQEHVVERITRPDVNFLDYQVTIEDPKVLTKPWTSSVRHWSLGHEPLHNARREGGQCVAVGSAEATACSQRDHEPARSQLGRGCKDRIEIVFVARTQNMKLQPEGLRRRLQVSRLSLGRGIRRVDEEGHGGGHWNQVVH